MRISTRELLQKIVAIIIIIILTLADFAIVGINAISYAIDMTITNSDNVQFCAYFVDGNGQQVPEIHSNINSNDLKVYIEVAVKNEGYFNGQITLEDSSLKFKENATIENEFIKEITEKSITLNQVNAGNTAKIEVGIEFINGENIQLQNLNKDNKINLTGIYKNSKKDVEIQGNTTVKVNWKSQEELKTKIGAKVITNKVYEIDENAKRIVQILVDSKLENDLYPIKNTNIRLNVPEGAENVKVHSRSTEATNGNIEFNEKNYQYNSETGILEINILNEENGGKISWLKDKKDSLVITYIYPESTDIEKQEINIDSVITTYDEKQVKASCKTTIQEEIDGILTSSINLDENKIYKGKLYTGEERFYTTSTIINVNYLLMDEIKIEEKEAKYCIQDDAYKANIQYVQTRISKSQFDEIFGQDGFITILDQKNNIIANINKDSEADENGYININYKPGVKSIIINTSKPLVEKTLKIYHRKAILDNNYSREQISKLTAIKEEINNSHNQANVQKIELKETESKAKLEVSTDRFSVLNENKNVEIIATLETNDESKDLYKNPSIDIVFPKEIKEINISSAKALYRNGLKVIKSEKTKNQDGNIIIHIDFEGEQKKYNSEILNGTELHIYAELILEKVTPSKNTEIIMNYTNDNGSKDLYSENKKINLESQNGLVLYNSISDFNKKDEKIEVIDEEQSCIKLDMNSTAKIAKVETAIINNYDKKVSDDVVIIGEVPVENKGNTFSTKIMNLKVNDKEAEVLYSTDAKKWTKQSTNAKLYKVILDDIDVGEVVKISYDMSIPSKLSYNEKGILSTKVDYSYNKNNMSNNSNIVLETETAILKNSSLGTTTVTNSGLEVSVLAVLGNKELNNKDNVYEGETIRYTVNIKNSSENDLKNVQVKATQFNGLLFDLVEKDVYNPSVYETEDCMGKEHYWEVTNSNIKEFEKVDIAKGESVTLEFQVIAKKNSSAITYNNISIISEENNLDEVITTSMYTIQDAELNLTFVPAVSEECIWYTETKQQANLKITNVTSEKLQNIEVQIKLSKGLDCKDGKYIDFNSGIQVEVKDKEVNNLGQTIITLTILSLEAGQTGEIYIKPQILDVNDKKDNVEFCANAKTEDSKIYSSNNIIRTVTRSRKEIKVSQTAKINKIDVNENTKANNGDIVEFYITVKNEENKEVSIYLSDYLDLCLELENITLIESDQTKSDLTNNCYNQYFTYNIKLKKDEEITIIVTAKINTMHLQEENTVRNKVEISCEGIIYPATVEFEVNNEIPDDGKFNISILQNSNPENNSMIKNGQNIEYIISLKNTCNFDRKINILDYFNIALKDIKVFVDNIDVTNKYLSKDTFQINDFIVKGNTQHIITIKAKIDLSNYTGKTISNVVLIKSNYPDYSSNTITFNVIKEEQKDDQNSNQDNNQNNNTNEIEKYSIKGIAWLDTNENGKREEDEERIKDLEIRAINTKTEEVLNTKATTDSDGGYELILPEGKYVIVFKYNNDNYYITTYHADKVSDNVNSDAISKKLTIENDTGIYGATDEIKLTSNKDNIDIGLINRSKFDLKLDKYVSKVVVTNKAGTKTYNLGNTNLGKIEIDSKYLNDSTVLVEYIIKVTNIGDIAGNVKNIVDNIPSDMTFSSSLNSDWYKSGKYLYNESLEDKQLDKGESAEVKLILTREMTDSNTGLVNNTAIIKSSTNSNNIRDLKEENDKGSADLIISIKTGKAMRFILLILSLTICIGIVLYYVTRRYSYLRF